MTTKEQEDFTRAASLPLMWQLTARQLVFAANVLREIHETDDTDDASYASSVPILLLYGFALENLLKGLLVAQGFPAVVPDAKSAGPKLNEEIMGHDLAALFRKAGLAQSEGDNEVLTRLSWVIRAGKYPVGTKPLAWPRDPTSVELTLTSRYHVVRLLDTVEQALARIGSVGILDRVDFATLGVGK